VTVREWIGRHASSAPKSLIGQVLCALGSEAESDASRTGDVCLMAAVRSLESLITNQRFKREDALELLTIDALMTFAYEHASQSGDDASVQRLVDRGAQLMGQLVPQRV
jgi:hypothetical protein